MMSQVELAALETLRRDGGFPIVIQPHDRDTLSSKLAARSRALEDRISSLTDLRRCFKPARGPIRFEQNFKADTDQLHRWLRRRWDGLKDGHDYPTPAPAGSRPDDWEVASWCDADIETWSEFEYLCRLRAELEHLGVNQLRLEWETEPRIRLKSPWRRLLMARELISAPPEQIFVIVELPDFVTRCLFRVCQWLEFSSSTPPVPDFDDWNRIIAEELDLSVDSDSGIARALILGTGLLLSDNAVRGLIANRTRILLEGEQVRSLRDRLVRVHPELDLYECRSVLDFSRRFELSGSTSSTTTNRQLAQELHVTTATGNPSGVFKLFDASLNLAARGTLRRLREPGISEEERADALLAVPRQGISGRLHPSCRLSEPSFEFLELADVIRKHALAELRAWEGHFIFWNDQLIGLLPEKCDRLTINERLRSVLNRCGQAFLGSAPALRITWRDRW